MPATGRFRKLSNPEGCTMTLLTEDEIKELKTAFFLLDKNHDGRVNTSELQDMLKNLDIHLSDSLIQDLLTQASQGAGLVTEEEFLQWVTRIQALSTDASDDVSKDLVAAFRVFDKDQNGFITKDEMRTAMEMIGEPVTEGELNEMLQMTDLDKDGRINYEEFARVLL